MTSTSENFFLGALIGGAIGAAAALMLTPLSGENLRQKIADGFNVLPNGTTPKQRKVSKSNRSAAPLHKPKSSPARKARRQKGKDIG